MTRLLFKVSVVADKPIVVGQDSKNGRRQLIYCPSGTIEGIDIDGHPISGKVLPGCVDSQVIRPDGKCELSARYGIKLDDGRSFYVENNGMRTVPEEYVETVLNGEFVDPALYYFATTPSFEAYDESLRWLERYVFVCKAVRKPDAVEISYYIVE